jgi:hypothetical protein
MGMDGRTYWSLLLDLKILVRTALGGFLSKNAY